MESDMQILARHLTSAPVDIHAIFEELGVDYREVAIRTGESGWIERKGDRFEVVVNANDPAPRRRFTAAHELAHYLIHRDLMDHSTKMMRHTDRLYGAVDDNSVSPFNRHHEMQANKIAAQILMPTQLVRSKFSENEDYVALAEDFGVSAQAMEIRLKTLGLSPRG